MDNLCHTLVGAALGKAGWNRYSRGATGTLMIASNLPDIDVAVLQIPGGQPARLAAIQTKQVHGMVAQPPVTNLARKFAEKQRTAIYNLCKNQKLLEATPVHEFVDRFAL